MTRFPKIVSAIALFLALTGPGFAKYPVSLKPNPLQPIRKIAMPGMRLRKDCRKHNSWVFAMESRAHKRTSTSTASST